MDVDYIANMVESEGYVLIEKSRMPNDKGTVLRFTNGCIVNCWDTGKINCQGKNTKEIQNIVTGGNLNKRIDKKKVFVVYGHDTIARTQLEAMLRRWDLEPLILDQLVSSGQTVIEKLEDILAKWILELFWQRRTT